MVPRRAWKKRPPQKKGTMTLESLWTTSIVGYYFTVNPALPPSSVRRRGWCMRMYKVKTPHFAVWRSHTHTQSHLRVSWDARSTALWGSDARHIQSASTDALFILQHSWTHCRMARCVISKSLQKEVCSFTAVLLAKYSSTTTSTTSSSSSAPSSL